MKVPTIPREVIERVATESNGRIDSRYFKKFQPEMVSNIHILFEGVPPERMATLDPKSMLLAGAAFMMRCLEEMEAQ